MSSRQHHGSPRSGSPQTAIVLIRKVNSHTNVSNSDRVLRQHLVCLTLYNGAGNWEKAAATISAPVLAVLLTDVKTATPFKPVPPDAAATPSAADASGSAAPAGAAAAAAAAAGISRINWSGTHYTGNHGSAQKNPAAAAPGVDAPFSMEQLALAMLRVLRRQDHVGAAPSLAASLHMHGPGGGLCLAGTVWTASACL